MYRKHGFQSILETRQHFKVEEGDFEREKKQHYVLCLFAKSDDGGLIEERNDPMRTVQLSRLGAVLPRELQTRRMISQLCFRLHVYISLSRRIKVTKNHVLFPFLLSRVSFMSYCQPPSVCPPPPGPPPYVPQSSMVPMMGPMQPSPLDPMQPGLAGTMPPPPPGV